MPPITTLITTHLTRKELISILRIMMTMMMMMIAKFWKTISATHSPMNNKQQNTLVLTLRTRLLTSVTAKYSFTNNAPDANKMMMFMMMQQQQIMISMTFWSSGTPRFPQPAARPQMPTCFMYASSQSSNYTMSAPSNPTSPNNRTTQGSCELTMKNMGVQ